MCARCNLGIVSFSKIIHKIYALFFVCSLIVYIGSVSFYVDSRVMLKDSSLEIIETTYVEVFI